MRPIARLLTTALLALSTLPLFAQETDRVEMIEDRENLVTELRVAAENGKVALADVFRAVSRFHGYDDAEIRGALPKGRIALQGAGARITMDMLNKVMRPCVKVHPDGDELCILVDRASAQQWVNDCKQDVRSLWSKIDWRSEPTDYGLELIGDVTANEKDIVVLVHGLNSRPEDLVSLIPVINKSELVPAAIRYPNDQPISESAKLLASELRELKSEYPDRKVRLLTHSMGGLVARAVVETDLDPGNISQLIMIAPPNQGSSLARVATFMVCYEFFTSAEHRRAGVIIESVADGLGEAAADLKPRSVFLDRLNGQTRNANVRYSILLGTGGPMSEVEMNALRDTVRDYTDNYRFTRFVSSKLNAALEGLNEVVAGKGDGAVTCERGKLDGVKDTVELPFSHANILNANLESTRAAYDVILDRLQ